MNFNANTPHSKRPPLRGDLQIKYDRARANLLLVLIVTVVNLFTVTFAQFYFYFSARIPMLFPTEVALALADESFLPSMGYPPEFATVFIIVGLVIGLILTVPYLLCWIFSKKHVGWLVAALAMFSVDCLLLLVLFDVSLIMDLLFHACVMFYLITGVINGFKLKDMPEEQPLPEFGTVVEGEAPTAEDGFNTFNEADFAYTADPGAESSATETADEAPVARSFDEIMAENSRDGE